MSAKGLRTESRAGRALNGTGKEGVGMEDIEQKSGPGEVIHLPPRIASRNTLGLGFGSTFCKQRYIEEGVHLDVLRIQRVKFSIVDLEMLSVETLK